LHALIRPAYVAAAITYRVGALSRSSTRFHSIFFETAGVPLFKADRFRATRTRY